MPAPSKLRRGLSAEDAAQRGAVEDLDENAGDSLADLFGEYKEEPPPKKPRVCIGVMDKRPLCVYGMKCYRRNPDHFLEYAHPWMDEENEDVIMVPAAPSAASTAAPSSIRLVTTDSAVGDRGAAVLEPEPEIAAVTTAPVAVAHEPAPPPVPPPSRDITEDIAPPRAEEGTGPPDVRMRIIALRSLLNSLVKDAARPAQRAHFARMLEMLDSHPDETPVHSSIPEKETTESKPPLPPPDVPPPLSMRHSAQASSASATGPAASSDSASTVHRPLLQPAPTVAAMPEEIAKVVAPVTIPGAFGSRLASELVSTDSSVDKIMDLGFSLADAEEALKNGRDIQAAIEWLLARVG